MINNSLPSKQFGILTPNTNKALAEVLNTTSVKELETLQTSTSKDLKSMMNSILKQTTNDTSSNKVLLDLVKNNPTLKNLGSVSTTIKDLLNSIKSDEDASPVEKSLKNILNDIKDLKGSELKEKLINSDKTIEKTVKNILSEIKKEPTLSKTDENTKQTPIQMQKDTISLEKTVKTVLEDITKSKDLNLKNDEKVSIPVEKVVKNFLTDIKDLKGSELKEKLTDLGKFIDSNIKDKDVISKDLKTLLSTNDTDILDKSDKKEASPVEKTLKNFLLDIKDLKGSELKQKFVNSGVFLESNIKNATEKDIKDISTNDLKVILHKVKEEISTSSNPNQNEILKNIDKLSLQIDNYQLVSYLSNGTSLYLPLDWDQLDEGKIEIKKVKEDKFFCNIDLKLKDFGDINLKVVLYEENQLNLHFHARSDDFRSLVKDAVADIRSSLIGINVTPREIRIFDFKENPQVKASPYATIDDNLKMGFEVKI